MKELKRTRRLITATIIFLIIIIIGLLTFRKPDFEYQLSTQEMLEELYNIDNEMIPDEAMEILAYGDSSYIFIDLRNPYEYDKGFLGDALNIPVSDILEKESIEFFKQMESDSVTVVFYSNTQREANGSWMLLKQLGLQNIKVLMGGYCYITNEDIDYYNLPEIPEYFVEEPFMDFVSFMEEASNSSIQDQTSKTEVKTVVPVKRKKKIISEGGC